MNNKRTQRVALLVMALFLFLSSFSFVFANEGSIPDEGDLSKLARFQVGESDTGKIIMSSTSPMAAFLRGTGNSATSVSKYYGAYESFSQIITVDGKVAYCVQPEKDLPRNTSYEEQVLNNNAVLKVLYYGYGGSNSGGLMNIVGGNINDAYMDTWMAIRIAYGESISNPAVHNAPGVRYLLDIAEVPVSSLNVGGSPQDATWNSTDKRQETGWYSTSGSGTFTVYVNGTGLGVILDGDNRVHYGDVSAEIGTSFKLVGDKNTDGSKTVFLSTTAQNAAALLFVPTTENWVQDVVSLGVTTNSSASGSVTGNFTRQTTDARIKKVDAETGMTPQGKASLDGTVIGLYDLHTDQEIDRRTVTGGEAYFPKFYLGEYYFKEISPGKGYHLNDTIFPFTADDPDVTITGELSNDVIKIDVHLKKLDSKTGKTPQGNGSLDGAVFGLYEADTNIEIQRKTVSGGGLSFLDVVYGDYYVKEIASGEGYRINNTKYPVKAEAEDITFDVTNETIRGGVKINKIDKELNKAYAQGDATLKGAEFSIINRSKGAVVVDGKTHAVGAICKVITTDENGIASTTASALPHGDYEISETKPSTGYHLDTKWKKSFSIREDGQMVDYTKEPVQEPIIRGGVQIEKWDKELEKSEALGGSNRGKNEDGTHLEGIVLTIKNVSLHNVKVDGKEYKPGEDVKKITTHWNEEKQAYTAETASNTLPYGTYTIRETSTTESYLLSDSSEKTFEIREEGKIVTIDTRGNALVIKDQVVRGDVEFVKIGDGNSVRMSVPWIITNTTTGEEHIVVTDKNGEFSSHSSDRLHSRETNSNDGLIEKAKAKEIIKQSEMKMNTGLWFSTGEAGDQAKVNDSLGALPYGRYIISELRCEANENYNLQCFEFWIYRNNKTVDLGTITNDRIEMYSEALDTKTDSHIAFAEEKTKLQDTVMIEGLIKGREYELRGRLVDLADGSDVIVSGDRVTSTKTFKAKKSDMDIKMDYKLDATDLAGKSVVVYVDLFEVEDDYKVAGHAQLDNEDQTIRFPKIETKAIEKESGDHYGYAGEEVTTIDTVEYTNLIPGEEYLMKGVLMDQSTGKELLDETGDKVTAEKKFTPDKAKGSIELKFTFDASLLAGKSVVVFEDCYQDNKKVATHSDIEDEGQTVHFPKIGTTAKDAMTGLKEILPAGEVTIVDTIRYDNMPLDREITVTGILMDKDSGVPLLIDDKEVTSEVSFTPETASGDIDVAFTFKATGLEGRTIVVFEKAFVGEILLASHEDIEDEGQTIHFPRIKTTATDKETGTHEAMASEITTIVDSVEYANLTPGNTYVMKGKLYIKTGENAGEALIIDGTEVMAEKEFTPTEVSGTIELEFTFDSRGLEGRTLVVFEDCLKDEILVATHADINDVDQSVLITEKTDKNPQTGIFEGEDGFLPFFLISCMIVTIGTVAYRAARRAYRQRKNKE